jgi:hypothetical protein
MMEALQRRDDAQFQVDVDTLIREAEERRVRYMRKHGIRSRLTMFVSIVSVIAGSAGFGWFLLMKFDLARGLLCIAGAMILPMLMQLWVNRPVKVYTRDYKKNFMPQLAEAFGGLKFFQQRGISAEILSRTGVMPAHDTYEAEDCFMGIYKGVKVIFSEARLYKRGKKDKPAFSGIFVLLEIPGSPLDGHTIVTSDGAMIKEYATTRWKKLQPVDLPSDNPGWNRFRIFSDTPDAAKLLVGERLLKELAEASNIFGSCPLTAVLFRQKYVFIALPHEDDMFEASQVHLPVASPHHVTKCKKEIERILEIIDVFELYKGSGKTPGKFGI